MRAPVSDLATVIPAAVSALAALIALAFAWQTVRETKALRREDRLARLPELVASLGDVGWQVAAGREHPGSLEVARLHVSAAIAATGENLPACERLIDADFEMVYKLSDPSEHERLKRAVEDAVASALQELADALANAREAPHLLSRVIR